MSTKLKIVSDLHYDFYDDHGKSLIDSIPNDGIDILVIAGDLTTDNHLENLSQLCGRFPQVVFVLGNHDYFRFGIEHAKEHIRNIQKFNSNLHYLDNDIKEINGVRFAGCTLWYPRPKDDIHSCWIDYRYCNKNMIWEENRKSTQLL